MTKCEANHIMTIKLNCREDAEPVCQAIEQAWDDPDRGLYGPGRGLSDYGKLFAEDHTCCFLPLVHIPPANCVVLFGYGRRGGAPCVIELYQAPGTRMDVPVFWDAVMEAVGEAVPGCSIEAGPLLTIKAA